MTYATLCTAQETYGVKVPYGHGTYTVHYDSETEALEVIEGLNRAYKAGFEAGVRSLQKESTEWKQGLQAYPVSYK